MNWVQINIQVNEDFRYMKIHIFALRWRDEIRRSSQLSCFKVISGILKYGVVAFSFGNSSKMGKFVSVGVILRLRRCGR